MQSELLILHSVFLDAFFNPFMSKYMLCDPYYPSFCQSSSLCACHMGPISCLLFNLVLHGQHDTYLWITQASFRVSTLYFVVLYNNLLTPTWTHHISAKNLGVHTLDLEDQPVFFFFFFDTIQVYGEIVPM